MKSILILGPITSNLGSANNGGIASHVTDLSLKLSERYKITILATGRYYKLKNQLYNDINIYGITPNLVLVFNFWRVLLDVIVSCKFKSLSFTRNVFNSSLRVNSLMGIKKFKVFHVHSVHSGALFCLRRFSNRKILTIHSYHDFDSKKGPQLKSLAAIYNACVNYADEIIHVSHTDLAKAEVYGVKLESHVVYNGIDSTDCFNNDTSSKICFVGSLIKRKRLPLVINACLHSKAISELIIAGGGAIKQNNHNKIKYIGHVNRVELDKLYSSCSVLVVPSTSESFGLVYLEALIRGVAVVGFDKTIQEFIRVLGLNNEEKQLVIPFPIDDDNPTNLQKVIEDVITFRCSIIGIESAKSLSNKVEKFFGWESLIENIEGVYF